MQGLVHRGTWGSQRGSPGVVRPSIWVTPGVTGGCPLGHPRVTGGCPLGHPWAHRASPRARVKAPVAPTGVAGVVSTRAPGGRRGVSTRAHRGPNGGHRGVSAGVPRVTKGVTGGCPPGHPLAHRQSPGVRVRAPGSQLDSPFMCVSRLVE